MPKFGTIPTIILEKDDRVRHKFKTGRDGKLLQGSIRGKWPSDIFGRCFFVYWEDWNCQLLEKEEILELI